MKNNEKSSIQEQVTLEGVMTFGKTENGLNIADFACCEYTEMTPFTANCKVQAMRDGNVYITEMPKRIKNHPIFRDDNSSLTLGRNGNYYFVFILPEQQVDELPELLTHQALAIAQKVETAIINKKEETL